MTDYLVTASYSPEGAKGVLKNGGTARADAVSKAVQGLGGTLPQGARNDIRGPSGRERHDDAQRLAREWVAGLCNRTCDQCE